MSRPEEHDYIGLSEPSSMEKGSGKLSSSSSTTTTCCSNPPSIEEANKNTKSSLNFKETELRLGLPGSESPERKPTNGVSIFGKDLENNTKNRNPSSSLSPLKNLVSGAKRGFSDVIDGSSGNWVLSMNGKSEACDLSKGAVLYSPRGGGLDDKSKIMKEAVLYSPRGGGLDDKSKIMKEAGGMLMPQSPKPVVQDKKIEIPSVNEPNSASAAKAQVVGWPPIRSFRKNTMASSLVKSNEDDDVEGKTGSGCLYVKVSLDGAPYLRKVDLKTYNNYMQLSLALEKMFSCFTIGQCGSHGLPGRDGLTASHLKDLLHGSEYVLTYEDRDGDWMLVGDVPWEMFTDTCRRLRIMKGSEAIGLAPRAMEKCKSRN